MWVKQLNKKPVFVAHPIGFDYNFVSWYLWEFIGTNIFNDENGAPVTLDLASYISGKYGITLLNSYRKNLPSWMKEGMPKHNHNSLDDARGFGLILRNVLNNRLV